ncbi:MAG: hypothetical protein ACR2QO_25135 [Acidimicrobiales bacterium]
MKKWFFPLAAAFVVYLIFSSPAVAGAQARTFAGWLGDLAGAAGEFLDGLFAEEATVESNDLLEPNQGNVDVDVDVTVAVESSSTAPTETAPPVTDGGSGGTGSGQGDSSDEFGLAVPSTNIPTPLRI